MPYLTLEPITYPGEVVAKNIDLPYNISSMCPLCDTRSYIYDHRLQAACQGQTIDLMFNCVQCRDDTGEQLEWTEPVRFYVLLMPEY